MKLYREIEGNLHYWCIWETSPLRSETYFGRVGEAGYGGLVYAATEDEYRKKLQVEIDRKLSLGYKEIEHEDHAILIVEYPIDAMHIGKELEKRYHAQERIDEILGMFGLGHCDGGSMNEKVMEVTCLVVDFELAKRLIQQELGNGEFSDFARIYREESGLD